MATNKFKVEVIFRKFQSELSSHFSERCDISNVLASFAAEGIVGPDEVNRIMSLGTPLQKVEMLLKHISGPLEAGNTLPFYVMVKILEQHGGMELAKQIWRLLSTTDHQDRLELERLYYQAKHDLGSEKLQLLKLLIFGPPGAGKSSLLKVLLGGDPDPVRNSTGVCDRHLVQCTIAVTSDDHDSTWVKVNLEDEIQRLKHKIHVRVSHNSSTLSHSTPQDAKQPHLIIEDEYLFNPNVQYSNQAASNKLVKQTSTLIACYDSGGQPEFFDVMPAITTTPTGYVMVFDMSKDLLTNKSTEFYRNGSKSMTDNTVHYTDAGLMKTALANIQSSSASSSDSATSSMGSYSQLLLVGTHLDECGDTKEEQDGKVSQVEQTVEDHILNVDTTVHIVECRNKSSKLVHPISNTVKADRDEAAQEIRTAIENMSGCDSTNKVVPISWLLFQLEIRHNAKYYISKSRCIDIAKKCYIKEKDVDNILIYFHELGVLLYYRNIPNIVFCDPQWLFDKLTKLIEVKYNPPRALRQKVLRGVFDQNSLHEIYKTDFSANDILSYEHLLQLFVSLNIMAILPGKTDQYFMPALLNPAPADIDTTDYGRKIYDTLIVKFENRYIPQGVFCCLVVECMRNAIGWHVLHGKYAHRDLVIFQISTDLDLFVFLRDKIDSITFEMYHNTLQMSPEAVCRTLYNSLGAVCSQLKISNNFNLGFVCKRSVCGDGFACVPCHPTTVPTISVCESCNHRCLLQDDQTVWLSFLSQQVQPPSQQEQSVQLISKASREIAEADNEVFRQKYSTLSTSMTDIDNLLKYFVTENIISTDDQREIITNSRTSEKARLLLEHISGPLEAGNSKPFRMMLDIMEKHGNMATKDLAILINSFLVTTKGHHKETSHTGDSSADRVQSSSRRGSYQSATHHGSNTPPHRSRSPHNRNSYQQPSHRQS